MTKHPLAPCCGAICTKRGWSNLTQIMQVFLLRRRHGKLRKNHFQATTFRRAAHGTDQVARCRGKRRQAQQRPALAIGRILHPDHALRHRQAQPETVRHGGAMLTAQSDLSKVSTVLNSSWPSENSTPHLIQFCASTRTIMPAWSYSAEYCAATCSCAVKSPLTSVPKKWPLSRIKPYAVVRQKSVCASVVTRNCAASRVKFSGGLSQLPCVNIGCLSDLRRSHSLPPSQRLVQGNRIDVGCRFRQQRFAPDIEQGALVFQHRLVAAGTTLIARAGDAERRIAMARRLQQGGQSCLVFRQLRDGVFHVFLRD